MCHSNLPCLALLTLCSITFNSSIQQPHFHCRGWRSTNMSTQNMLSQMLFLQSQQQGYQWYWDKHGGCLCDVKLLHEPLESTIQNWTHRWMQIPMMLTENWMNENWLKFEWLWCFFLSSKFLMIYWIDQKHCFNEPNDFFSGEQTHPGQWPYKCVSLVFVNQTNTFCS